jgi:mono/diheme cytochrome c family protein
MPAWPDLSEREVEDLIGYLKTFSASFEDASKRADPIEVPEPPTSSPESIERGRKVYEDQGCEACHGELGRGDGSSGPMLTDDWGKHIRPADLTQRWTFRGGPTPKDIFRTFSTGLNGTPMPSYFDSLEVADRWDLVHYIASLGEADAPGYADLLRVAYVEDEIALAEAEPLFDAAPPARFPLIGQIIQPGRNFHPAATSLVVQAVHNRREIAFRVRWNDMQAETSGSNAPDLEVPRSEEDPAPPPEPPEDEGGGGFWGEEEEQEAPGAAAGEEDDFWGEGGEEARTPSRCTSPPGCPAECASPTSSSATRSPRWTCGSSTWRAVPSSSSPGAGRPP